MNKMLQLMLRPLKLFTFAIVNTLTSQFVRSAIEHLSSMVYGIIVIFQSSNIN